MDNFMSVLVLRVSCLTLFNLQGARSRALHRPVSAQLLYHIASGLSRTFFKFFSARPAVRAVSRDSFDRIPPFPPEVKHFFRFFFFFSFFPCLTRFLYLYGISPLSPPCGASQDFLPPPSLCFLPGICYNKSSASANYCKGDPS